MKKIFAFFSLVVFPFIALSQCAPATGYNYLDVNNVRARMNVGGSSWWDTNSWSAQYEVPAGSGTHSFYTGSFWIGGLDVFDVTHVAATRFRQVGYDFWPGPLNQNGEIDSTTCLVHDRIYKLNRWEVEEFIVRLGEVGYVIPDDILEWPANGNPFAAANAQAPFKDVNADGIYNPLDGDYPAFAINEPTDRDYHLLGDQCLWWVENDAGNLHTETGGEPLGVELQCMAYAFATCDPLNDQTFYRYKVINKSQIDYHDTYIGLWADADLGFANDDYVQCEVMRHLGFVFNGFNPDGVVGSPGHYGEYPPAAGIGILEGPLAIENDGIDNDRDGVMDEPGEHLMMSHFVYHNNSGGGGNPAQNDPSTGLDYYNYMRGIWLDGEPMCYGGAGHPNAGGDVSTPCDFMYPGESDPLGYGTEGIPQPNWTEQTAGNVPFDRRFLLSSGPFDLGASDTVHIHYGALWARDTLGTPPFASAEKLFDVKDLCQDHFESNFEDFDCCPPVAQINLDQLTANQMLFSSVADADTYFWDFGDGTTSSERFPPWHLYLNNQIYEVMLVVSNACGSDTAYVDVSSLFFGVEELDSTVDFEVFPVPATDFFEVRLRLASSEKFDLVLYTLDGKEILRNSYSAEVLETTISTETLSRGLYVLSLEGTTTSKQIKVALIN